MQIFKSRFTPNAKGEEVNFSIGEKVKYQLRDGSIIDIIIDSERMSHENTSYLGYETIFTDDGERCFAIASQIVGWEGKVG